MAYVAARMATRYTSRGRESLGGPGISFDRREIRKELVGWKAEEKRKCEGKKYRRLRHSERRDVQRARTTSL